MMMMMVMVMLTYKTNTCHKFVTLIRFLEDDDGDNADADES